MRFLLGVVCLLVVSCAFDYGSITVKSDEPIRSARLTLNGKDVEVERVSEKSVTAKWQGGEASGEFLITFSDGSQTSCLVGYLEGSSFYREEFVIADGTCEPIR